MSQRCLSIMGLCLALSGCVSIHLDLEPLVHLLVDEIYPQWEQAMHEQLGEELTAELVHATHLEASLEIREIDGRARGQIRTYSRHEIDPESPPQWMQRLVNQPDPFEVPGAPEAEWWLPPEQAERAGHYLMPTEDPSLVSARAAVVDERIVYLYTRYDFTDVSPTCCAGETHISGRFVARRACDAEHQDP